MGRAKNTLNAADVSSTPIKVKYSATYSSSSFSDYGIALRSGSNNPYNVTMSSAQIENMDNYRMIRQLYYKQSIDSVVGSSSFFDPFWISTAASGTYDSTKHLLPTQTGSQVLIFAIPSHQFGEQISRKTFAISSSDSSYLIVDDGNGNLIDTLASNEHVGNIFYAQGIAVVTNQDYIISYNYLAAENDDIYETENNIDIIIE